MVCIRITKWIRVARRIIRKHNTLKNNNPKLTPMNINDNKQTDKPLRSINHRIVPPIPLADLKKRKSTDIMRFFQPTSNKRIITVNLKEYKLPK